MNSINRKQVFKRTATSLAVAMLTFGSAWADDAETTIRLMSISEAMGPDEVMNDIMLPSYARVDVEAVRKHEKVGDEPGSNGSEETRDNTQDAADEARTNREDGGLPGDGDDDNRDDRDDDDSRDDDDRDDDDRDDDDRSDDRDDDDRDDDDRDDDDRDDDRDDDSRDDDDRDDDD